MLNDSPCTFMDFYPKKKHSEPCCINFEIFGSPAVLSLFLAPTSYRTSGMRMEDRWWEEAVCEIFFWCVGTTKIGFLKAITSQKTSSDTEHLKKMKTFLLFPLSLGWAFDLTQEMWYVSEV